MKWQLALRGQVQLISVSGHFGITAQIRLPMNWLRRAQRKLSWTRSTRRICQGESKNNVVMRLHCRPKLRTHQKGLELDGVRLAGPFRRCLRQWFEVQEVVLLSYFTWVRRGCSIETESSYWTGVPSNCYRQRGLSYCYRLTAVWLNNNSFLGFCAGVRGTEGSASRVLYPEAYRPARDHLSRLLRAVCEADVSSA